MIRERIANWLTGGELEELRAKLRMTEAQKTSIFHDYATRLREAESYREAIQAIYIGTKDVKHGTAQKVARMCKEALE